MIIFQNCFKNYDEFKNIFGISEHGNGVKSRRNKILLGVLKDRDFRKWWLSFVKATEKKCYHHSLMLHSPYAVQTMDGLKDFAKWLLSDGVIYAQHVGICNNTPRCLQLDGWRCYSSKYRLDALGGVCIDGDIKSVRYSNIERDGRIFKMKAGKFLQSVIDENAATRAMPEQLKRWCGEEFSREWQSYASIKADTGLTLHVDDDFKSIYSRECCKGDFGSCMSGRELWRYYRDSIKAKAAYLTDREGLIVARCIVYQEVYDEVGNTYRLAERQYASGQQDTFKQILVDMLIAGGHIDGYKRIGADCHDNMNFVLNNGTSLSGTPLYIECSLEYNDPLSYQDSFIYYDVESGLAYNDSCCDYNVTLDTTDGYIKNPSDVYSEYHGRYIDEDEAMYDDYFEDYMPESCAVDAIYDGQHITIDREHAEDRDDLFCWSDDEDAYIYRQECVYVDCLNDYILEDNAVTDINGDYQRRSDCTYSHYHGEWILDDYAKYSDHVGDYLDVDQAVWSDYECDWLPKDEAIYSIISHDYYSSEENLLEGEAEFRRKHALVVVA